MVCKDKYAYIKNLVATFSMQVWPMYPLKELKINDIAMATHVYTLDPPIFLMYAHEYHM